MRLKTISKLALVCGVAAGCAATTPKELSDARSAYQAAANGDAATYDPAELHTAKKALTIAEKTFEDEGDSARARDRAYIALRRAQLAEQEGHAVRMDSEFKQLQQQSAARNARELTDVRSQLDQQRSQLEQERLRREDAERRAAQAASDLARIASVKQDARGMVITLSGGVLFASGKSELLPSAQAKLGEVARALGEQSKEANIVVEGHTDSQGSDSFNQKLSLERAQSVSDYLASHGVAGDRIRAEGVGESRPIADNKTAEGRANNRRVEIVVQPTTGAAPMTPGATPGGDPGSAPPPR
jgi:outer membrane protein OmpA-like peptidoglycan-associated protein